MQRTARTADFTQALSRFHRMSVACPGCRGFPPGPRGCRPTDLWNIVLPDTRHHQCEACVFRLYRVYDVRRGSGAGPAPGPRRCPDCQVCARTAKSTANSLLFAMLASPPFALCNPPTGSSEGEHPPMLASPICRRAAMVPNAAYIRFPSRFLHSVSLPTATACKRDLRSP